MKNLVHNPPRWAQELSDKVLAYWNASPELRARVLPSNDYFNIHYPMDEPIISWKKAPHNASGVAYARRGVIIRVHPSASPVRVKLVLLHELAHFLLPVGEHHSDRFWVLAWNLYRKFGLPIGPQGSGEQAGTQPIEVHP